jgi:hypothetical protein
MDLEAADRLDQVARYLNRGPSVAPRGPRSDPPCCRVFRVHIEVLRGPALNTGNARSEMRVHSANALPQARPLTRRGLLPIDEANNQQQIRIARIVSKSLETVVDCSRILRLL